MNKLGIILVLACLAYGVSQALPVKAGFADVIFSVIPNTVIRYTDTTSIGDKFNVTLTWNDTATFENVAFWNMAINYNHTLLNHTAVYFDVNSTFMFYGEAGVDAAFWQVNPDGGNESSHNICTGNDAGAYFNMAILEFQIMAEPSPGETVTTILNLTYVDATFTYGPWFTSEDLINFYQPITANGNFTYVSSGETPEPPAPSWHDMNSGIVTLAEVVLPILYLIGSALYFVRTEKKPDTQDIIVLAVGLLIIAVVFPLGMNALLA